MKTKQPADKPKQGFNPDKFRRHYVSAVESDDASITEDEKGNLGRIFTFLLLLHVFLIGAVVLYNLVADKPKSEFTQTSGKPKESTAAKPRPMPVVDVASHDDLEKYTVASGQSLQNIADATGATQEQLIALNHLDENGELFVGRTLVYPKRKAPVPMAVAVTEPAAPAIVNPMAVAAKVAPPKAGAETFAAVDSSKSVAKDSPTKEFVARTKEEPQDKLPETKSKDTAPAGPVAAKPKTSEPKAVAKAAPTPAAVKKDPVTKPKETAAAKPAVKKGATHEVKPKETFYSIAKRYGVSVNELMKANGMTNAGALRDGTKLKIPSNG